MKNDDDDLESNDDDDDKKRKLVGEMERGKKSGKRYPLETVLGNKFPGTFFGNAFTVLRG